MNEAKLFKPEEKFIQHSDQGHEASLEKKGFDFEYQKEFKDFFLKVFKEVNIDVPKELMDCFDPADFKRRFIEEHKGSGYIAPSSYLADSLMIPFYPQIRLALDKKIITELNWRGLPRDKMREEIDKAYLEKVDIGKLISFMESETDQAKKNLLLLIIQIVKPDAIPKTESEVEVKLSESGPLVGDCERAEMHMLAFISGRHTKPKNGYVNLITDDKGSPLMLEKMDLGYSNSCISLAPIRINGVLIPAGAIFAAHPVEESRGPKFLKSLKSKIKWFRRKKGAISYVKKLEDYKGFKFLRMSLLSLPEDIRASAGGQYYLFYQDNVEGYINYDWLTPEIIAEYARDRMNLKNS